MEISGYARYSFIGYISENYLIGLIEEQIQQLGCSLLDNDLEDIHLVTNLPVQIENE
jgi:hypothetical protein